MATLDTGDFDSRTEKYVNDCYDEVIGIIITVVTLNVEKAVGIYILSQIKAYESSKKLIVLKKYCTLETSKNTESRTKNKLQKVFHVMRNSQNADFAINFFKA